jgi:hypothetical protein
LSLYWQWIQEVAAAQPGSIAQGAAFVFSHHLFELD